MEEKIFAFVLISLVLIKVFISDCISDGVFKGLKKYDEYKTKKEKEDE